MAAGAARPIRLSRAPTRAGAPTAPADRPVDPAPPPAATGSPAPERRENRAATRRARRLALLFVVGIAVLFLAFALAERTSATGGSPGALFDLWLTGGIALLVALAGAVLTLTSAPTAVELSADAIVVVGVFGGRRRFGSAPNRSIRTLRRMPVGWLTPGAIESVEIAAGGVRRTYLMDEGLLAPLAERP